LAALSGPGLVSITIKDVVKLAGSEQRVSRVANGAINVSDEARTKVLTAISRLQYSPCTHAIGLRRANGGDSPQSLVHLGTLVGKSANPPFQPVSDYKSADQQSSRLRVLVGECKRVGRAISELSKDLEKLSNELENLSNGSEKLQGSIR
jgi:DNA-binding LacI/PurR family transcriptional regulator